MSKFPTQIDDDTDLPPVNDNLTEIGAVAVNATRDAIFNIENNIGLGAAGNKASVAERLSVSFDADGYIVPSMITALGLVDLPIRNVHVAEDAAIDESKLRLNFKTQDLYNYTKALSINVNSTLSWQALTGVKLQPHIDGILYNHTLSQIEVSNLADDFLKNKFGTFRNNNESYLLIKDINNELLDHQFADGSPATGNLPIVTNNGSIYGSDYAHTASGIFLNPSRFSAIPQTVEDLQRFAEYIDSASIFLYGSRIQNLYSNGIPRSSRSSALNSDGYGQLIIPGTPAITYLLNNGGSSSPVDDINIGDDIIEFTPSTANLNSNAFDEKFALVKVGDIITVNYGTVQTSFVIKERKYTQNGGNKKFVVRIAGKNLAYSANAIAQINKPLANSNKSGVLAISTAVSDNNVVASSPSLVIGSPRGAQALGLGFNPDQFDSSHYLLYLALYPTGIPADGYVILPGIDVTGNRGTTPGKYTLDSIVASTNSAFRKPGNNFRFTAYAYQGEFGIMLADSYNNTGFSIFNAVVAPDGSYDPVGTGITFQNNVVGVFSDPDTTAPDPLGFGVLGAGIASPPFKTAAGYPDGYWDSPEAAVNATKLFLPLKLNNTYVNGVEIERFPLQTGSSQAEDTYGDGYWVGSVFNLNVLSGRVQTTYRILQNLEASDLKAGKTIVVQSLGTGTVTDFGRFTIESITFGCLPNAYTDITVYDAIHASGVSPVPAANRISLDSSVAIYFSSDSVSFNTENSTDTLVVSPFKRHFEVYINQNGKTFTHERGRINVGNSNVTVNSTTLHTFSELVKLNIIKISPKLRGYQFGSVNKISLNINSFIAGTGFYDGYLTYFDDVEFLHKGPITTGYVGQVTRFFDESNNDYIDILFGVNDSISSFSNKLIDFQLFPTLSLDNEIMLLGTCQVTDGDTVTPIKFVKDERQFGNISEKDLSSSVLDYLTVPERLLHSNGVIRGFYLQDVGTDPNPNGGQIYMSGGMVLVNGKFIQVNSQTVIIPPIKEIIGTTYNVNWLLCINKDGEYQPIPMLDFDEVLATPTNPGRLFNAFNVVNGANYALEASTFSNLVNERKDLTLLYVVSSTVTGSGLTTAVSLTVTDARRYVYNQDWGQIPTIASGTNNGEFRDFTSLISWFNLNSTYTNSVNVKGIFENIPASLAFNNKVELFGDGDATFATTSILLASNIGLNNLNLIIDNNFNVIDASFNNVVLSGSGLFNIKTSVINDSIITTTNGVMGFFNTVLNNVTLNLQNATILEFTNCTLNNCIINCNLGSSIINFYVDNFSPSSPDYRLNAESNFINNVLNFNSSGNIVNFLGNIIGNTFNYNSTSNTISLNDNINVLSNRFNTGISTLTTQFLSINDGVNGIISQNAFYRNSNNLTSYIKAFSSTPAGVVSIVNNFFDSPTINGTNQNLIQSLPLTWIYSNNVNTSYFVNTRRVTSGASYNVQLTDHVLLIETGGPITINLPDISIMPPGRILTIKDIYGSGVITLHRGNTNDAIEGLYSDFVYRNTYGSITIVSSSDFGINDWTII